MTAEDVFKGERLETLCDQSYYTCNVTAGCRIDGEHYLDGTFPGTRRAIVDAPEADMEWSVRVFLKDMLAPGSEMLVQMYEPDCTLDTTFARAYVEGDIFVEAGRDRTLIFELQSMLPGEHLVEVYSDATTGYLLIIEPADEQFEQDDQSSL